MRGMHPHPSLTQGMSELKSQALLGALGLRSDTRPAILNHGALKLTRDGKEIRLSTQCRESTGGRPVHNPVLPKPILTQGLPDMAKERSPNRWTCEPHVVDLFPAARDTRHIQRKRKPGATRGGGRSPPPGSLHEVRGDSRAGAFNSLDRSRPEFRPRAGWPGRERWKPRMPSAAARRFRESRRWLRSGGPPRSTASSRRSHRPGHSAGCERKRSWSPSTRRSWRTG